MDMLAFDCPVCGRELICRCGELIQTHILSIHHPPLALKCVCGYDESEDYGEQEPSLAQGSSQE